MGAPGNAFICEKGHLYHWIEEHLCWDDELWAQYEKQKCGCPCGAKCALTLSHYGEIGDCLCSHDDPNYPREIRKDRVRVKDNSVVDKFGNSIDAYRWIELPVYDLDNIQRLLDGLRDDLKSGKMSLSGYIESGGIPGLQKEKPKEIESPFKVEIKEKK
jgi:hypothetical protein